MAGYDEFKQFENFKIMNSAKLDLANNYVCFQLNNPLYNYRYYYDMYSYIAKCRIVLQKYKVTELGDAICGGKLVNFLKDLDHKNCSCGSVYFNAVFKFFFL